MPDKYLIQAGLFAANQSLTSLSYPCRRVGLCLVGVASWLVLMMPLMAAQTPKTGQEQVRKEQENLVGSFTHWQSENPLDGKNGALDNPDGDGYSNLVEFAIGQPADTGLTSDPGILPRLIYDPTRAKFDFAYRRRKNLPANLMITLLMTGYDGYEQPTGLEPNVSDAGGDFEKVVYADVESDLIFQGLAMGKLRLKVTLDAETDHHLESKTALWCWRRQSLTAGGSRSFAMPLVRQEVYCGRVADVTASVLELGDLLGDGGDFAAALLVGERYYVEVTEGPLEGQRWEVDELACTADGIALDLTSSKNTQSELPDLTGMRVAVRPHQTLSNVIRTDRLLSATRSSQADRVQFWEREQNCYTECWLSLRAGNVRQWVQAGDSAFADAGMRVIPPDEGLFLKLGSVSASLPLVGLCRETDLIVGLGRGANFVGTGWTDAASPEQLGMLSKRVFNASTSSQQADRIRIWNNQSKVSSALAGYYLRASNEGHHEWILEGDADMIDQNQAGLLNGFEALFFLHPGAPAQWRQPDQAVPNNSMQ